MTTVNRPGPKPWTIEEERRLSALIAEGRTWDAIAEAMGRSYRSVRMRAYRGAYRASARRDWTPEEDERLVELRRAGSDWFEIAEALGRTPPSCEARLRRLSRENDDLDITGYSGPDYLLMIRLDCGYETAIARGSEDEVRGIYRRMRRTVPGLWVVQAEADDEGIAA